MAASDWVQIGAENFTDYVYITEISEEASILYTDKTGRTLERGAPLTLDPLGTFYGHKVTFARKNGFEEKFDALYQYLTFPRFEGIPVRLVHDQTTLSYTAYVSSATRKIKKIDEKKHKVYWDAMSVSIIPIEAQLTPYDNG